MEVIIMNDKLIQWAQAGDGDCAYKLAMIFKAEGDLKNFCRNERVR